MKNNDFTEGKVVFWKPYIPYFLVITIKRKKENRQSSGQFKELFALRKKMLLQYQNIYFSIFPGC